MTTSKRLMTLGAVSLAALLTGVLLSTSPAVAQEKGGHSGHMSASSAPSQGVLPLSVTGATVAAVPPSIKDSAAYMTLTNTSAQPIKLVGVSAAIAAHPMLMNTVRSGKMLGMKMTPSLTVPARGKLVLRGDGDHVMLMGLKRPLKVGETVKLTLKASDGRTLTVSAVVRKP